MATLTNVNPRNKSEDEEEKPLTGQSSSMISPTSAPTGPATGGVQQGTPSSGRFTNLNQYMNANKQAGTKLGQAVGQNVNQAVTKSTTGAQQAQQGFQGGLQAGEQEIGKIKDYTQKLGEKQEPGQPGADGLMSQQTGPAYLASGYQANLGNRANYAQQLAGDENALNTFLNYRSGKVAQDQQATLQKQQQEAQNATTQAEQTFADKQKQVSQANNRGQLLSDVAKSRTYGTGQQSLDNAFLQMDKGNTLGNLKNSLKQQQQQFAGQNMLPKLSEQLGTLQTGLGEATTGLQKQTEANLADLGTDINSRQKTMEQARTQRLADLQKQFETLQSGGEITQDFANAMGLTGGQTLYNTLVDVPNVSSYLDTKGLQAMPMGQGDLANQNDVNLYSAFARLAQTNPAITQASGLTAEGQVLPDFAKRLAEGKEAAQNYAKQYQGQYSSDVGGANPAEFTYDPTSLQNALDQYDLGAGTTLDQLLAASGTNMDNILGHGANGVNDSSTRDVKTPFGTFRLTGTSSSGGEDENFIRRTYSDVLRDMANQGALNQVRIAKENK